MTNDIRGFVISVFGYTFVDSDYHIRMNESIMRHLIATCATLVVLLAYVAGYLSGGYHWWWTGFALVFIYLAIFKLVDAGHH